MPLVVSDDFEGIQKTKDAYEQLKKIGASEDVDKAKNSKTTRRGKGKMRNRRTTQRRGPLIVYANENASLTKAFRNLPGVELCHVSRLNLLQLAPGGHVGRFVIWSKSAFDELNNIYGSNEAGSSNKAGFQLPRSIMTNPDLGRIINSDEIQSVLNPAKSGTARTSRKRNPLKNRGILLKLNPYALEERRQASRAGKRNANRAFDKEQSDRFYHQMVDEPESSSEEETDSEEEEDSEES
jgi:large subunit ribosomal protein L4e